MSSSRGENRVSALDQFASTYLHARWFLGFGLIGLTLIIWIGGLGHPYLWVAALAGTIIIAHAYGMTVWKTEETSVALFVDASAGHGAVLIFATANSDRAAPLLTVVGSVVLIGLFATGWRRVALVVYTMSFGLLTLTLVAKGDLSLVVVDLMSTIFVVGIILGIINAVRRRLAELEASRAQTIGVVSHELRNYLTGVIGVTELLTEEGARIDESDMAELLGMAHQQASEAGEVIEDLLIASRAERGVLDTIPEPVDLGPPTATMIRRAGADGTEIAFEEPGEPIWAMVDPLRYSQILRNLLTNAERYGGPKISVSIEPLGALVSLVVADNGSGVSPADAIPIFQPYHRARDRAAAPGSTGLGLWIARSLAQRMGGTLTYSRHDHNTIFELLVPSAEAPMYPAGENLETHGESQPAEAATTSTG
ncbi:MAG: HAMP domain-containing sensor histidine kinase [Acidimicrobiia bacterium]